jgi:protein involved in polysaccharide export with SLBB domain
MTGGRLALAQTIACLALLAPWIVARAQDQMIQGGAASAGGASAPAAAVDPGTSLAAPGSALESAVDADAYRLGPGDVLTIGIWGPQPIVYDLPVTLEGKLLLPSIGVLPVDGLPLGTARDHVRDRILQDFRNVEVTVTLTRLRKFQIHVLGQVQKPGTYLASAVDRVSSAVNWAGGLTEQASQRGIRVQSQGELRATADLFAFLQRGIARDNPLLQDGDIVYVPFKSENYQVRGAVNQPGAFEHVEGDRLSDAIFYAGGLTADAFIDTIEVARYPGNDAPRKRFFIVDGRDPIAADSYGENAVPEVVGHFRPAVTRTDAEMPDYPDIELEAGDIIFVRAVPEERLRELVEVRGEVVYPGFYPIVEGETRLSDVVSWAGGLTPEAFLQESQLIRRESLRQEDREFERLRNIPVADMKPDEYEYFKVRSRETPGLMVVDFHELFVEHDREDDLLLRRGDVINIATRRDFISVLGMVSDPGNIPYERGLDVEDYIDRSGGYADRADEGKTRVIRAGTGEWVRGDDARNLGPGDTVWVPEKPDRDWWGGFKDVVGVTTQILTIYLIAERATQ